MNIYLLRHPAVALSGVCYGRSQVPLKPEWLTQVPKIREGLPSPIPQVHTSPAPRCMVAAGFLGGPNVKADERLLELDFGEWEMKPWKELPEDEVAAWSEDLEDAVPHCGESGTSLMERAVDFFGHVTTEGEDVLVVTHAGWIRALLAVLLGTDLDHAFRLDIGFLSLTQITVNGDMINIPYINKTLV